MNSFTNRQVTFSLITLVLPAFILTVIVDRIFAYIYLPDWFEFQRMLYLGTFHEYLIAPFIKSYYFFIHRSWMDTSLYNIEWLVYYAGIVAITVIITNRILLNHVSNYLKNYKQSLLFILAIAIGITVFLARFILYFVAPVIVDVRDSAYFNPISYKYYLLWSWPLVVSIVILFISNKSSSRSVWKP